MAATQTPPLTLPSHPLQDISATEGLASSEMQHADESVTHNGLPERSKRLQRPQDAAEANASSADSNLEGTSGNTSEEDYRAQRRPSVSVLIRRKARLDVYDSSSAIDTPEIVPMEDGQSAGSTDYFEQLPPLSKPRSKSSEKRKKTYVVASDDMELREILRRGLEREKEKKQPVRREKLREMVFTRQFSTFDRQNQVAANSPFHGFYTLFWIAVAFLIVKMAVENWRKTGSPLGTNDVMKTMFRRDVIVLFMSDGVMCGITGFGWVLQRLILVDWINWNKTGLIIQNLWQVAFLGGVVGLTLIRDWPWTHTVFFVLHGLVMLMKQHSYAFTNGYLSTVYKKRRQLLEKLKQLESISPISPPSQTNPPQSELSTSHLSRRPSSAEYRERRLSISKGNLSNDIEHISHAIDSGKPLDMDQLQLFERMIKWEIDAQTEELKGKPTDAKHHYPNNLTFPNHYEFIVLPTLVYELEYPRSDSINFYYVAEKGAAGLGVIFVMIMVSQTFIYPVVMQTIEMKDNDWSLARRFHEFPWLLSDLVFPFMMEYLLAWYLIWETVLNFLAELTYFADRSFYDAWWNSVSWDQFARDWNRPVHNFLLRHVYHSSISSMRVNKHTATLITFFLSACVHELVMLCIFKKLRGYLLFMQMCQLPLVRLSRTKWLRNQQTLGNMIFWVGIFTGPSLLCSLYLIL